MSGFYILDVPEFRPVAEAALKSGAREGARIGGYRFIEFDGAIDILRADTRLPEAIWYGCLTGGLEGRIAHFDSERLQLVETNEPILPA